VRDVCRPNILIHNLVNLDLCSIETTCDVCVINRVWFPRNRKILEEDLYHHAHTFIIKENVVAGAWLHSAVEVCGGLAQGTGAEKRPNWPQLQGIRWLVALPYMRCHRNGGTREESRGTVCSPNKANYQIPLSGLICWHLREPEPVTANLLVVFVLTCTVSV